MNRVGNFEELRREIEIVRRVIDWIAAENQQGVDLTGIDVGTEFAQRFQIVDRRGVDRFGVINSVADVAERGIDCVYDRVYFRGLLFAGRECGFSEGKPTTTRTPGPSSFGASESTTTSTSIDMP